MVVWPLFICTYVQGLSMWLPGLMGLLKQNQRKRVKNLRVYGTVRGILASRVYK